MRSKEKGRYGNQLETSFSLKGKQKRKWKEISSQGNYWGQSVNRSGYLANINK